MPKNATPVRFTLSAAALALCVAASATAVAAQPVERPGGDLTRAAFAERAGRIFERMDLTGDGRLDQADRAAHQAQRFGKLDADGSGEVSMAEMQAAQEARKAKTAERRVQREAKVGERMERRFAMLDRDGSGGLSPAELAAARDQRERRLDRGGDRDELRGQRDRRHGRMDPIRGLIREADSDGNRVVTRAEFDRAVASHFARLDSDGNGTVTAAERKAARAALKPMRGAPRGEHREVRQ